MSWMYLFFLFSFIVAAKNPFTTIIISKEFKKPSRVSKTFLDILIPNIGFRPEYRPVTLDYNNKKKPMLYYI